MNNILLMLISLFLLCPQVMLGHKDALNLYIWAGEIPDSAIAAFEKETGIEVNVATYDSNEVLYAKLKSTGNPGYDVVMPSSYYVARMHKENMLQKIDKSRLPLFSNLDPDFLNLEYDPGNAYSVPFLWGTTGIFVNTQFYPEGNITRWSTLWEPRFNNQLLLLDDTREVFSMALLTLGYSPNDRDPEHIKQAYLKAKAILPNAKLFNSTAVPTIISDDDVTVGMVWNGDLYKASEENPHLEYVYPEEGFVIWVDNLAIPNNAPHLDNAYRFINFVMRPEIAVNVTLEEKYASANSAAQELLPPAIRHNHLLYPDKQTLKRGRFQTDVGVEALALYEKYWTLLKVGG